MAKLCKQAFVTGKVQGVFYRACTQQRANQLGVSGYAKNLADGRVEVIASGDAASVQGLIDWLATGSPASNVEQVEVLDHEYMVTDKFEVL